MAPADPISRRTLAAGAAWSVPAVLVGTAAPAVAASVRARLIHQPQVQWYGDSAPWCTGTGQGIELSATEPGEQVTVLGATHDDPISDASITFWMQRQDMTFTAGPGGNGCWSAPARTGQAQQVRGVTLYGYTSTYTCAITPQDYQTRLQPYDWRSQCYDLDEEEWYQAANMAHQAQATVGGTVVRTELTLVFAGP